jgi:hypothetical protein
METVTDEVTEKRGRGRPRKRKLRTDERLLTEIEAGRLDERTKPALAIKQTIRALEDDQKAASLELLRRDIAVNKVLEDVVVNLILNSPESLVNPTTKQLEQDIFKDLLRFQEQNRRAILAINQVSQNKAADPITNAKAVLEVDL